MKSPSGQKGDEVRRNTGDPEGGDENSELVAYGGYWAKSRGLGSYYLNLSSPSNSKHFSGTQVPNLHK